jgi:hypothetical protein
MPETELEMEEMLREALETSEVLEVQRTGTFAEDGLLTRNHGVTVRFDNGAEFQLTIVMRTGADSPAGDDEED